tara:strand:+ start:611 stop:823 length:213 start_codon:yes stop_codon:yes gene_type:complete
MSYVSQGLYLQELKNKKIATETNRQSLIKLDKDVKEIAIIVKELKNDVKEILEYVKRKEERDLNKWMIWQ